MYAIEMTLKQVGFHCLCQKSEATTLLWIIVVIQMMIIQCFPVVKQGILAITGIPTCGQSNGYCIVDENCSSIKDFSPDQTGHCDMLKASYSSSNSFSCCRLAPNHETNESKIETTTNPADATTISMIQSRIDGKINKSSNDIEQEKSLRFDNGLNDLTRQRALFSAKNIHYELELEHNDNVTSMEKYQRLLKHVYAKQQLVIPELTHLNNLSQLDCNSTEEVSTSKSEIVNIQQNSTLLDSDSQSGDDEVTKSSVFLNDNSCLEDNVLSIPKIRTKNLAVSSRQLSNNVGSLELNKCLNISYGTNIRNENKCANTWKFINEDGIFLCFGTILNPVWLLTSAACVTRIFKETLNSVFATDFEGKSGMYRLSNVIVHENYEIREKISVNNIGLVSLNEVVSRGCYVCLSNQNWNYMDKICSIHEDYASLNEDTKLMPRCRDRLKALTIDSKIYLSISCSSRKAVQEFGNLLWCEDALIGVETINNEDFYLFTAVYEYSDWIMQNIQLYL